MFYDDLTICNSQGVYKGGQSNFQNELNNLANTNNSNKDFSKIINSNDDAVAVFPNPTTSFVTIKFNSSNSRLISFELSNILGVKLFDKELTGIEQTFDLPKLSKGIYLYIVKTNSGKNQTGKLLIE